MKRKLIDADKLIRRIRREIRETVKTGKDANAISIKENMLYRTYALRDAITFIKEAPPCK